MRTPLVTRLVALIAVALYLPGVTYGADKPNEFSAIDNDWPAIEHCLGIIRLCQMDDGMIRMKGYGDPVWTVPYFSNLAAMALLVANDVKPNPKDVAQAERWLMWYASHQEADGTIYDQEGTIASYGSNGKRDATDSYAATFLMTAWRYRQAIGKRPSVEIINAARRSLAVIEAVVQDDGLTIAKPEYPIKFLMDNIEVYQGLIEGASFFQSVGLHNESKKARTMASWIAGSLRKYWSEQDGIFAYAIDMKGNLSIGLSKPYPHGLAQLFALSYITPGKPGLWSEVKQTFKPGEEGIPVERWLIAAIRNAEPGELKSFRETTRKVALSFTSQDVYVERPAMTVLALLNGEARFPDVPMPIRK